MNEQLLCASNCTKLQLLKRLMLIHIADIKQSSAPNNLLLSMQLKEISQVSFKNFRQLPTLPKTALTSTGNHEKFLFDIRPFAHYR